MRKTTPTVDDPVSPLPPTIPLHATGRSASFWCVRLFPPLLALLAGTAVMMHDQTGLMLGIQSFTKLLSDRFWSSLTLIGHGSVAFAFLVLAWRYRKDWLLAAIYAAPVAGLYTRLVKNLFTLPRPAAIIPPEQLHIIGHRLVAGSFPSGHTVTAFLLAGVILLSGRVRFGVAAVALAIALGVGLSRIAVGAHWPADVLVGAAGGWLSAACGVALARRFNWPDHHRAWMALALVSFASSASMLFIDTGYPLGLVFQYFSACVGMVAAALWMRVGLSRRD